jgi:glycerate kinase
VDFYDENGNTFVPVGGTLDKIKRIDITRCREFLKDVEITAMCDIDNPMHGERGSAYVFSPQKGADEEMVRFLDGQLKSLDRAIQDNLGLSVADVPGSGAAGAFGAGMLAFFGAELKSGIETVLDIVEFDRMLEGCDLVFTGEGKLDSQSLDGKVICGVAKRSKAHNVPVVVTAGTVDENVEESREFEDIGVSAVFSINRKAQAFEESKYYSKENYRYTMNNILRLLKIKGEQNGNA